MGTVADVLRETKRRIEVYGWIPEPRDGGEICGCALDHLDDAELAVSGARYDLVTVTAYSVLVEAAECGHNGVGPWNDRQTSVEPVLAAVARAIEIAEQRGL